MTARTTGLVALGVAVSGAAGWLISPFSLPSDPEQLSAEIARNRDEILLYSYLGAVGAAAQVVVFAGLRQLARSAEAGWARIGLASMLVEVCAIAVAFSIFASVAVREPGGETAQVLTDLAWLLINLASGPVTAVGLSAFAIALTRGGQVGGWLLPFTAVVALAHLAVAATFARDGFLAPDGGLAVIVPLLFFSWIGLVGVTLVPRAR